MGIRTYRATGALLGVLKERIGMRIRVTGQEHLSDRPTLYVVNHFTRFETLIVPYVLYQQTHEQVRTLANDGLFKGSLGKFLRSCGVASTRDPKRDEMIVGDLITGRFDWVIYPEGGLVKNKRTVSGRKFELDLPHRKGPPHTGAAILALRAEMGKRLYRQACDRADKPARERLESRYALGERTDVCEDGTVIVPVTITYNPLRADRATLANLMRRLKSPIGERTEDELRTEGTLLLNDGEMGVHFSSPIEVGPYLAGPRDIARRVASTWTQREPEAVMLRNPAVRLTRDFMREIYGNIEVNLDHLVATALRESPTETVPVAALHRALFLAANELCVTDGVRVHPSLRNGITPLLTGERFAPLERAIRLAESEGVLRREDETYVIDQELVRETVPFQRVRMMRMTSVIANEVEPVRPAVDAVRRHMRATEQRAVSSLPGVIAERDRREYLDGMTVCSGEVVGASPGTGQPFFLEGRPGGLGVVLVHGYLSRPEEMRPLGERLNNAGYSVYGVRLDGHGTRPEDLVGVEWSHWIDSIRRGYAALDARCERVVVGGLSLGGVLALNFAAAKPERVAGVFTINAPIKLRDSRAKLVPALVQLDRLLRATHVTSSPIASKNRGTESPDINYGVNYITGVRELRRAILHCRRRLRSIKAPALIIQSDGDPVVQPISANMIHDSLGSERKRLLNLHSDQHIVVRDNDAPVAGLVEEFLAQVAARPADR